MSQDTLSYPALVQNHEKSWKRVARVLIFVAAALFFFGCSKTPTPPTADLPGSTQVKAALVNAPDVSEKTLKTNSEPSTAEVVPQNRGQTETQIDNSEDPFITGIRIVPNGDLKRRRFPNSPFFVLEPDDVVQLEGGNFNKNIVVVIDNETMITPLPADVTPETILFLLPDSKFHKENEIVWITIRVQKRGSDEYGRHSSVTEMAYYGNPL